MAYIVDETTSKFPLLWSVPVEMSIWHDFNWFQATRFVCYHLNSRQIQLRFNSENAKQPNNLVTCI